MAEMFKKTEPRPAIAQTKVEPIQQQQTTTPEVKTNFGYEILSEQPGADDPLVVAALKTVDWEARRDRRGNLSIYALPSGDLGGSYEIAGINDRYHPEAFKRIHEDDETFYIRESHSAPLDTAKGPRRLAEELRPSKPRTSESQKAFDVFRPPGYQRPVHSGDSGQHLLNGVNEGIYIVDEPLPLEEATVGETRPDLLVSLMRRKSGVD